MVPIQHAPILVLEASGLLYIHLATFAAIANGTKGRLHPVLENG